MRRKDREMPREFAMEVAGRCQYAVLGLIGPEGEPYAVPVSIAVNDGSLYFHSALKGTKADCIRKDSRVSVVCVGDTRVVPEKFTTEYESAILKGRAFEVTGEREKMLGLRLICEKYAPGNMDKFEETAVRSLSATAVWRIDVEEATRKSNK